MASSAAAMPPELGQELPPADAELACSPRRRARRPAPRPASAARSAAPACTRRWRSSASGRASGAAPPRPRAHTGHLLLVEQSVVLFPDATRFVPFFDRHVRPTFATYAQGVFRRSSLAASRCSRQHAARAGYELERHGPPLARLKVASEAASMRWAERSGRAADVCRCQRLRSDWGDAVPDCGPPSRWLRRRSTTRVERS